MKNIILMCIVLLVAASEIFAQKKQKVVDIDVAIKQIVIDLDANRKIADNINIAILNFSAPTPDLSKIVIDKLTAELIKGSRFNIIDASNRAAVQKEINSGETDNFDPQSASQFGRLLNAKTVVFGTIAEQGKTFILTLKATDVETTSIQAMEVYTIKIKGVITEAAKESKKEGAAVGAAILSGLLR